MIRTFLTIALPLIAPTVAYLVWMHLRQRQREDEQAGRSIPSWQKWPWPWLVVSGALLAAVALVTLGYVDRSAENITKRYIPPHVENGEVVPGRFEDAE